jgi:hypothetical protein
LSGAGPAEDFFVVGLGDFAKLENERASRHSETARRRFMVEFLFG